MITETEKFYLNHMNNTAGRVELGSLLAKTKNVLAVVYDVAVDGGATGTHALNVVGHLDSLVPAVLPSKAIIMNVVIDIVTAFTSTGNNGTLALTAQSSGDLLAAVDADTLSNQVQGIPAGAVGNMIKLTADRTIIAAVATNALLTGKAVIFIEYVLSV
jgi:hypothetical protein